MTTAIKRKKTPKPKVKLTHDAERKALVDSLCGSMPDLKISVDVYLKEKYAETDAENLD